jgi:hypothetical protein
MMKHPKFKQVSFTSPPKNLWDELASPDKGIAQWWYLFLKPLSPGVHIVHYTTVNRDSSDPTIPLGQGNVKPYIKDLRYRYNNVSASN